MKKHVLFVGCLFFSLCSFAQNKTLGVGVTTPNTHAALHVESPTSNQGFILPRLTTVQRTASAFVSSLSVADNGLMVYDTNLNTLFIWDGIKWNTSAQVAGGPKLQFPYKDSIANATGTPDLFKLQYNNAENKRLLRLENLNTTNASSVLSALQTGPGFGVFVQVNNAASGGTGVYSTTNSNLGGVLAPVAIYGESTGTGSVGGAFRINNTGNSYPAAFSETNGSGPGLSANNIGTGPGVASHINNPANTNNSVYGETNGLGRAGFFTINNPANQLSAIYATTNGTAGATVYQSAAILGETSTAFSAVTGRVGAGQSNGVSGLSASTDPGSYAVLGSNSGAGPAGIFGITNASNSVTAFEASTIGTGGAGKFTVNNVNSVVPALRAETNSNQPLSAAIYGLNTGTGDVAASFRINNTSNNFPALFAESNGGGRTAVFRKLGTTGGAPAVFVESFGGHGIWADHNHTNGYAAIIQTINTGNPNAGLYAESVGSGPSIWALKSTDAVGGNAFTAENQIATGSAANFNITDASNPNATLYSSTSGTGAAIMAQTSTGFAAVFGTRDGASNGNAAVFDITNASNSYPTLQANTIGTGSAGNFQVNNTSSGAPSVFTQTNGTGTAISAVHTGTGGDAVWVEHQGNAQASAGNFRITTSTNNASALFGSTQSAGGTGVGAMNTNNGVALAIWQGGMKVTTQDISSTSITTRAMAYRITGGGTTFTFSFSPSQGDTFLVFNETGAGIQVEGVAIPNGEGKTLIHFGGAGFRGF